MDLLINIDVDDLEAGAKFYQEALDLRRGRRLGDGVVELLGGSSPIYLLQKPTGSETSSLSVQRRDYSRHWTPVHLDFVVDDFDAAVSRALAAGARLEAPLTTETYGRLALFSDPWGHGFCLLRFTGRGYDEIAE